MANRFSNRKGPSQRQLRAGELIRHALVDIMRRETLRDPALEGVSVTVSEVRLSPDLKQATVFASPLGAGVGGGSGKGAAAAEAEVIEGLNRVAPFLRGLLGKAIDMKFTPALKFRRDEVFAEAQKIDALLARPEVARDLGDD